MFLLDNIKTEDMENLSPDVREFFKKLIPLLEKIKPDKLDRTKSRIKIIKNLAGEGGLLNILIIPKNRQAPSLRISALPGEWNIFFNEDMMTPSFGISNLKIFARQIYRHIEKFLTRVIVEKTYEKYRGKPYKELKGKYIPVTNYYCGPEGREELFSRGKGPWGSKKPKKHKTIKFSFIE